MELRKDYILDRWVVIAPARKQRPKEYSHKQEPKETGICYFCPGSEHLTPPEIGRIGKKNWRFRWFANRFPAVDRKGNPHIHTDNGFFTVSDAYGSHEVIVETPSDRKQLWDLTQQELVLLFSIYRERIEALGKEEHTKYVAVFKNHGASGGASLKHSHTQVASLNILPPLIQAEAESAAHSGTCAYCTISAIEKTSFRRCFENESAVAFAPYASRYNYEIWIFPKKHKRTLDDFSSKELADFAALLHKVLKKLKKLDASYNFVLHYSPDTKDLHFHVEVTPRMSIWAGFEMNTEIIINSVTPEDAARFYRGEAPS